MTGQSKSQAAKVVTANKLLTSILHGSSSLLPSILSGAKPKEEPGKTLLLESIDDDNLWYSHIKATKDSELLQEACRMFPNYWKVHHRCALFHLLHKHTRQAFDVYTDALKDNDDYMLYVCYLKFLYHMASVHEYIAALFTAIDKVGLDIRSDPLWKELITLLVKIYNCKLMERNVHTGLLPNLFPSEVEITSGSGPLYPSEAEQVVFRGVNTLDKKEQTYVQLYSDVNHIRKIFQRWLKTPTNNLKHGWEGYSTFENIVSAANVLCSKLLADAKVVYELSMNVYDKLSVMYRKVLPAKPACKRQLTEDQQTEHDRLLECWIDIIKYEEINPLNLTVEEMLDRVAFTFRSALNPHVFSSRLWYMYFQFLLANYSRERGIKELKGAIDTYLCDDSKLRFVLAAYLDEIGNLDDSSTEFKKLIEPVLPVIEGCDESNEEEYLRRILQFDEGGTSSKIQPAKIIHYLNYLRRNFDRAIWEEEVSVILHSVECSSWELHWYAANTQMRCYGDVDAAVKTLQHAYDCMPFDMYYTILHLRFLLDVGEVVYVRVMLTELLMQATVVGEKKANLSDAEKMRLWSFWFHVEYFYGSKDQFFYVHSKFIKTRIANEVGLDVFAEKSNNKMTTSIRQLFGDIGPTFVKMHMDSSKRVATQEMNAVIELRERLFCAGFDYDELDSVFALGGEQKVFSSDGTCALSSPESDAQMGPSNFTHPSATDEGQGPKQVSIVRPDTTSMSSLDPENSGALEALTTLHGSRRPVLPEEGRPIDSVATPPKLLFDLLRVLPTSTDKIIFPKMYGNNESVDYFLRSLDEASLDSQSIKDYAPIPIDSLLRLKNSASSDDQLFETSLETGVDKGTVEGNSGLSSVIQFVEEHTGTEDKGKPKRKGGKNKAKLAI
ncbi:hypothetical protein BaOVIS_027580 [Babesia ovis]|uniref:Suppressor of forked domain-containing protein n=1 Tax=Babesia ovis TaxID=5869 RepID=A0A9W5TBS4_BABOV|nr:hypothetical protein BaOVIS_027580 [Babesia ovis]